MFGNIVNNKQFLEMRERKDIEIDPFHSDKLKTIHYPLQPEKVLRARGEDTKGKLEFETLHDFDVTSKDYTLDVGQYVLVRVQEFVWLNKGIIGHFLPGSDFIDRGLVLSAGRLEHPFGKSGGKRQKLQFGVYNASGAKARLTSGSIVAWLYLVDLRGLNSSEISLSEEDVTRITRKMLRMVRAEDDGVFYDGDPD
jgi:deoxycytidine triphosphate deaminase